MKDYTKLTPDQQKEVIKKIKEEVFKHTIYKNGKKIEEPANTIKKVKAGEYCAKCFYPNSNCQC